MAFRFLLLTLPLASGTKVLCLHGGGSSADAFRAQMKDVMADTPGNEYVFANAAKGNWFEDPPDGKGTPTQDPDWDKASIELINRIVTDEGPFDIVLGFSQGSAFIPAYLSIHPRAFQKAALLSGYLPSTHQGVLQRIRAAAPFTIPALVYYGKADLRISNDMTREQARLFKNVELVSDEGTHKVPSKNAPGYKKLIYFLKEEDGAILIWPWILAALLLGVLVLLVYF